MYIFLTVITIIVCIFLVLIVLVQNPKGGGLSSSFGGAGGSQMMGVQRTNDFLEKATWGLAIALVVLSLSMTFFMPNDNGNQIPQESEIQDQINNQPLPAQNSPAPIPIGPEDIEE